MQHCGATTRALLQNEYVRAGAFHQSAPVDWSGGLLRVLRRLLVLLHITSPASKPLLRLVQSVRVGVR